MSGTFLLPGKQILFLQQCFPISKQGNIDRKPNVFVLICFLVYQSLPLDISNGSTIYILIQNHRQSKNELETKSKALMTSMIPPDI